HDVAGTPVDRFIRLAELGGALESVQMISDMQVIKPGATLYTGLHLFVPTFGHLAAFTAAWLDAAPHVDGRRVINPGGTRSGGYGLCEVTTGEAWHLPCQPSRLVAAYETPRRDHRAEILARLEEIPS